jgi:Cation/multidrug efflux pump
MISEMNLPESIKIEPGGELEVQSESFGSMGTAMLISLLLVYLIMVLLYNSYIYPLVVFFSIPLAIIGSLLSSMFLTLVIVPLVYYIADKLLAKFGLDKEIIIKIDE